MKQKSIAPIATALGFSLLVPVLGYTYLGALYASIFLVGYLDGFLLWLSTPSGVDWRLISAPFWLTLIAFLALHKVEENRMGFFDQVSARITGTPIPDVPVGLILAILVLPVGAWIAIPVLIKRHFEFGRFLAWTFFASMGITELAHFLMPVLAKERYGYSPGMLSVFILALLAWWGMARLLRTQHRVAD